MASIIDALLLVPCSYMWYVCSRNPNAKLSESDRVTKEPALPWLFPFGKGAPYLFGLIAFTELWMDPTARPYISLYPSTPPTPYLNSLRALGFLLVYGGGLFRIWAMRTLNKLFTFQLAIRAEHKLIRSGPYALVRHPSYTGIYALNAGALILLMTGVMGQRLAGTWACGPRDVSILCFVAMLVLHVRGIWPRVQREEVMLKGAFGKQWDDYVREVPSGLFPAVPY